MVTERLDAENGKESLKIWRPQSFSIGDSRTFCVLAPGAMESALKYFTRILKAYIRQRVRGGVVQIQFKNS
jgi:hypothetical protein